MKSAMESKSQEATVTLNTGQAMPVVGLGTFRATKVGEVSLAVKTAVTAGYRLIDCAAAYGNQNEIGEAISGLIEEGVVERKDLFIVSKLFQSSHDWEGDGGSRCRDAIKQTLKELKVDYLDLYLIHWPFAFEQLHLESDQPLRMPDGSPNPLWNIKMEYLNTWKAMEAMVKSKKVRAIGVSNFTTEQLEHLKSCSTIIPAVNQVEFHPYLYQKKLLRYCTESNIKVMAYSPLGSSSPRFPPAQSSTLLNHPTVLQVAAEAGRSPGQVLIRWSLEKQCVVIPKSTNLTRVQENYNVQSWNLTPAQVAKIDKLDCGFRYFMSYLKRPDNDLMWHDGCIEA